MALSGHGADLEYPARGLTGGGHRRFPGCFFEQLPENAVQSSVGGCFARLYLLGPIG